MGVNTTNAKEMTRQYFDSLWLEQRLMDSCVPETDFWLYGQKFSTPVMTAALSHLGTFHPDAPNGLVDYAMGAKLAGTDAYKALPLGATAVSVGIHLIPFVKQGAEAVAKRIGDMTAEMKGVMAYTGVKDCKSFDAGVVHRV